MCWNMKRWVVDSAAERGVRDFVLSIEKSKRKTSKKHTKRRKHSGKLVFFNLLFLLLLAWKHMKLFFVIVYDIGYFFLIFLNRYT